METEVPSRKSMLASQACARTVGGPSLAPQNRSTGCCKMGGKGNMSSLCLLNIDELRASYLCPIKKKKCVLCDELGIEARVVLLPTKNSPAGNSKDEIEFGIHRVRGQNLVDLST